MFLIIIGQQICTPCSGEKKSLGGEELCLVLKNGQDCMREAEKWGTFSSG